MKKNMTKKAALLMSCLVLSLTGCGEAAKSEPSTAPTQAAEPTATSAPTEAPATTTTTAPTESPVPTATIAPTVTPVPTATAAPTEAPVPTATTAPTVTPIPTATAAPTEAPVTTPEPTSVPAQTPSITKAASIADILPALRSAGIIAAADSTPAAPAISGSNVVIETMETLADHFIIVTLNGQLSTIDTADISFEKYNVDWNTYKEVRGDITVTDSYSAVNDEGKTVLIYQVADTLYDTSAVIDKKSSNFSNLESAITTADNYLSWQMDHGGWDKGVEDQAKKAWNGKDKKNKSSGWTGANGELIGTIDNDATYTQMRHIAAVYREVPESKYQESVLKGLDFLFHLQYESGGFAQVYPKRGNYSDNVTFNDNAMINVLYMLEDMLYHRYPFDSDIIPEEYMTKIEDSLNKATDYILNSQIVSEGKLTAWCAQHDPVTYEPVSARAYELASISGNESVAIVQFLMNQEQTPEIKLAVESALQWFKESEVKDIKYVRKDSNGVYFVEKAGESTWYRFYEIDTNLPIFCDRDGIMKHNILEIGEERRHGYSWAGTWPKKLLDAYEKYGYVTGTITATVTGTGSATADGKTLEKNASIVIGE